MSFGVSWPPIMVTSHPSAADARNCPPWPHATGHYSAISGHTLGLWPSIPTIYLVLGHGSSNYQVRHDYWGSLLLDRAKPAHSDTFHLQEGLPSSVLSLLLYTRVLREITPLQLPLAPWVPWDQLNELRRECINFMDDIISITNNGAHCRVQSSCFPSLSQDVLIKDRTHRPAQLVKLQALTHWMSGIFVPADCWVSPICTILVFGAIANGLVVWSTHWKQQFLIYDYHLRDKQLW